MPGEGEVFSISNVRRESDMENTVVILSCLLCKTIFSVYFVKLFSLLGKGATSYAFSPKGIKQTDTGKSKVKPAPLEVSNELLCKLHGGY